MDPKRQIDAMKRLLLSEDESGDIYRSFYVGGNSFIDAALLWDGILLWANEIHTTRLNYPENIFDVRDCLLLNICHSGRCEVELMPGSYVYMSPGILNVSASPPKSSYYYPGGTYSGIEICFNMQILKHKMPEALTDYGFDYSLLTRYAAKENMMAALTGAGMQEEEKLFNLIRGKKATQQELRFAALSLIYHLINGEASEIEYSASVSKGQRRIVTEAEQLLTADFRRHYTIEETAARFGISGSALKKYFAAVYGRPISQYMREKRMKKAMELLTETDGRIGEIALACGYEHQGKFGEAFKEYAGVSPLEYRRINRKPTEVM